MRTGSTTFAALVLLVSLALGRVSAQEPIRGTWSIGRARDTALHLTLHGDRDTTSFDIDREQLPIASALAAAGSHPIAFTIAREPGSIACTGTASNGAAGGTFVFTPSETYRTQMRERGDDVDASRQLAAVGLDLTTAFVDRVAAAGYPQLSFDDLITLRALGIDGAYIERVAAHGFTHLPIDKLIQLKALDVISAHYEGRSAT